MSCVHFTGIQNVQCKAGVRYEHVRPLPCLGGRAEAEKAGITQARCDFFRAQTAEEVAGEDRAMQARFDQLAVALTAIGEVTKGMAAARGEMPCPVCSTGSLRYEVRRSGRGRHGNSFAAKCSTDGCVEGRGN